MGVRGMIQERKRECWQSQWRVVRRDPVTGMPTHYVKLTQVELMEAATTGNVSIPDSHLPQIVLDERDALRELEESMGPEAGEGSDMLTAIASTVEELRHG